ncbi:Rho GTPase-activating protein [Schistosoma japonicum]|uniref:Rho GTPase-activating protein n=1 Tax=Schistosoma japonicum TaxID=6182 RepID=A0A4Z2DQZ2_SCHJA|nr:Rho GTPase-activating protein [Schistosoma japonicum]
MPALSPLEFRDCVVDSPNFRKALSDHEADLKTANRKVKSVLVNTRRVFEAMESLNQAFIDYAASLKDFSEYAHQSTYISQPENEVCETDDDITIKNALSVYATIIGNVEEARRTMIQPNKEVVLNELSELRSLWLGGQNTNAKSFQKETKNFCQYLEKYASIKSKEFTEDNDSKMLQERKNYIVKAFEYVANINEAHELKKSKFVQTISLIMRMLSNFYYQAFEQFKDSSHQISQILRAAQRSSENYEQISLESKTLTEKLLNTPWEQIQSTNLSDTREGYVFVATKKAVVTVWTKNFCTYNRNSKILKLTPYTQYQDTDNNTEVLNVISCRRRSNDSIDRRWCFDVEVAKRTSPITLQAQCLDDLHEWLLVMDGKEPIYEDRRTCIQESDNIELNDKTYEFLNNLIYAIEKIGIQAEGIYRTCGLKSKVSGLIKQALSPSGISKTALLNNELCVLTGALKCFIRQLETPIMTFQLHDSFMSAMKRDHTYRLTELSALLKLLPQENQRTLDLLIRHLSSVASQSKLNHMNPSNLGIVFAPSLFRSREESVAALMSTKFASTAVELMIINYSSLFPIHSSNILPPIHNLSLSLLSASIGKNDNNPTSNKITNTTHNSINSSSDSIIAHHNHIVNGENTIEPVYTTPIIGNAYPFHLTNSLLNRSQNMFTSSNWEKYSSQTSLQSFQSSTCTSSFSTPPPPTTTASKSQSSSTSSSSLPIAIQIVHDNEYISSQHEQNSTNEKVLNHHPSLSTTTSPYFHLHHHLIDPPPKLRVPQRVSPNPSIHLTVPHSFKKPPPPPPPTPTLSVPSKYVNTMPVTCLSLKPPTFTQTSITTSATIASTTNSSSFISENFRSTHNLSDECKDLFS